MSTLEKKITMESCGNKGIPVGAFACKDQTVRTLDFLWLQEGGNLRKRMKMLTKRTLWTFKESQRGFKIQIYRGKTCGPCHLL